MWQILIKWSDFTQSRQYVFCLYDVISTNLTCLSLCRCLYKSSCGITINSHITGYTQYYTIVRSPVSCRSNSTQTVVVTPPVTTRRQPDISGVIPRGDSRSVTDHSLSSLSMSMHVTREGEWHDTKRRPPAVHIVVRLRSVSSSMGKPSPIRFPVRE